MSFMISERASDITLLGNDDKQLSFVKVRLIAGEGLDRSLTTFYTLVSGDKSRSTLLSW